MQLTLQVSARCLLCRWNFSIGSCPSGHGVDHPGDCLGSLLGPCERCREAERNLFPNTFR
jgi:hypothetical protein